MISNIDYRAYTCDGINNLTLNLIKKKFERTGKSRGVGEENSFFFLVRNMRFARARIFRSTKIIL